MFTSAPHWSSHQPCPHFADAPVAGSVQGNSSHLCTYGASAAFCKVCTLPLLFLSCQYSRLFLNWLAFGSWALPPHSVKGPVVAGLGWSAEKGMNSDILGLWLNPASICSLDKYEQHPWLPFTEHSLWGWLQATPHQAVVTNSLSCYRWTNSRDTLSPHGSWVMELGSKAGGSGSEPRKFLMVFFRGRQVRAGYAELEHLWDPSFPLGKALLSSVW